jgi:hypothetical protein
MIISVHQPQYIPWLGYFDKIAHSDAFVFLDNVQYKPREFQNRNKLRTKDDWIWLTVPVTTKGQGRQVLKDVRVDNGIDWPKDHLASIKAWYGRAPYYDRHFQFFADTYDKRWESLSGLSVSIVRYMMKELSISTPVYFESELGIASKKTDRIVEICGKLKADKYLSGIGGKEYLEEGKFASAGIGLLYQEYKHPIYRQQFMKDDKDFLPYMSAVDLLLNEGERSREILNKGHSVVGP